jgi:hypothetical protein
MADHAVDPPDAPAAAALLSALAIPGQLRLHQFRPDRGRCRRRRSHRHGLGGPLAAGSLPTAGHVLDQLSVRRLREGRQSRQPPRARGWALAREVHPGRRCRVARGRRQLVRQRHGEVDAPAAGGGQGRRQTVVTATPCSPPRRRRSSPSLPPRRPAGRRSTACASASARTTADASDSATRVRSTSAPRPTTRSCRRSTSASSRSATGCRSACPKRPPTASPTWSRRGRSSVTG